MSHRGLDRSSSGTGESFRSDQYLKFADYEIEIMHQPLSIKKFIKNLIIVQNLGTVPFYPLLEEFLKATFNKIKPDFDFYQLKYNSEVDLDRTSKIIAFFGESGTNYIYSVKKVIPLNQPTLLFYGIEQLASFYSYLFFHFSQENSKIDHIRKMFRRHGIDPFEFNNIDYSSTIDEILLKKVKLLNTGAVIRFFFTLGFPIDEFFFKKKEFSLLDLMYIFFTKLRIGLDHELVNRFLNDFELTHELARNIEYYEDLDLLVFYSLSFLFSHLSRYKIANWQKLLQEEEKNLGFYIKFIIDQIDVLFIRKIFSLIQSYKNQLWILIRHPEKLDQT